MAIDENAGGGSTREEPEEIDAGSYLMTALAKMGGGETHQHLGEKLLEAVRATRETGCKSTVSFKIEIKARGKAGQIEIKDAVSAKLPDFPRVSSIYFTDVTGRLHRDDPAQRRLPFGEHAEDDDEPRLARAAGDNE